MKKSNRNALAAFVTLVEAATPEELLEIRKATQKLQLRASKEFLTVEQYKDFEAKINSMTI